MHVNIYTGQDDKKFKMRIKEIEDYIIKLLKYEV